MCCNSIKLVSHVTSDHRLLVICIALGWHEVNKIESVMEFNSKSSHFMFVRLTGPRYHNVKQPTEGLKDEGLFMLSSTCLLLHWSRLCILRVQFTVVDQKGHRHQVLGREGQRLSDVLYDNADRLGGEGAIYIQLLALYNACPQLILCQAHIDWWGFLGLGHFWS